MKDLKSQIINIRFESETTNDVDYFYMLSFDVKTDNKTFKMSENIGSCDFNYNVDYSQISTTESNLELYHIDDIESIAKIFNLTTDEVFETIFNVLQNFLDENLTNEMLEKMENNNEL